MYTNVSMIWRPISGSRFLEYNIDEDVLPSLGITRTQLTALGIVSRNDYNRNIAGLGCATNYKIIKEVSGSDVPAVVSMYLSDPRVILKNKDDINFDSAIKVFVWHKQTVCPPLPSVNMETLEKIKLDFKEARTRYHQRQNEQAVSELANKRASPPYHEKRHKSSQEFNRYRVIDKPPPSDKPKSTPPRP